MYKRKNLKIITILNLSILSFSITCEINSKKTESSVLGRRLSNVSASSIYSYASSIVSNSPNRPNTSHFNNNIRLSTSSYNSRISNISTPLNPPKSPSKKGLILGSTLLGVTVIGGSSALIFSAIGNANKPSPTDIPPITTTPPTITNEVTYEITFKPPGPPPNKPKKYGIIFDPSNDLYKDTFLK